jgi:hypothetical protein
LRRKINFHFDPIVLKKFNLSWLFFMLLAISAAGQDTRIRIFVKDPSTHPYTGASLMVTDSSGKITLLKKVLRDKDTVQLPSTFMYHFKITAINKKDFDTLMLVKNDLMELDVVLFEKQQALETITVVSRKSLMKDDGDKTIVDAGPLSVSSTNAFEVVEKTPGAVIDQDGNIYLTSTTPATVFINGREMKLSSADLSSLLKSLPANSVEKIEILRSPSAKFDAASSGGIINIVLKKGVKLGRNGSVNASYFQGVYATMSTGFSINNGGEKTNSYINYQYTGKSAFEELRTNRLFDTDSIAFTQQSYTRYPGDVHYVSWGADHTFNSKWNLSFDHKTTLNANHNSTYNNIDIQNPSVAILRQTSSTILNNNRSYVLSNVLNSKCKIDTMGSEWIQALEFLHFNYRNNQQYDYQYTPTLPNATLGGYGNNTNRKNNFSYQSDLTLKSVAHYTIETGLKISYSKSDNKADFFQLLSGNISTPDLFQTNTYQFREVIGAAYGQLSRTVKGFTIKPGLRLEYTYINGRQSIPTDTGFLIRRTDLFPYLYVRHKLFKMYGQTLMGSAIFRKSIRRPYYESLNPYPRYVDQFLYEAGNPVLKPQFTTTYEINVTFNEIPVLAAGLNNSRDLISNVIYQDTITKVGFRTFDNLGANKEFYGRLIGGIPPGGKYFFYLGGVFTWSQFEGYYQGFPLNYKRGSVTCFTFHEYKFTKTFSASMQAFMRINGLQNFYELNNFGGMTLSLTKNFFNRKLSAVLAMNDVFRTNRVSFQFDRNGQQIAGQRINDTRRLGLTLRYNFGIKPKEEKKEGFGNFENQAEK